VYVRDLLVLYVWSGRGLVMLRIVAAVVHGSIGLGSFLAYPLGGGLVVRPVSQI
jgi:hypothetical protein